MNQQTDHFVNGRDMNAVRHAADVVAGILLGSFLLVLVMKHCCIRRFG